MDAVPTTSMLVVLAGIGVGTGVLGAILGTGGGVLLIPILVLAFHQDMHYAVGTSILSVIATSTAVASTNVERGTANMRLGMTLEVATSIGAISGGLSAAWMPGTVLQTIFSVVLIPTAVLMWRRRGGDHGPALRKSGAAQPHQGKTEQEADRELPARQTRARQTFRERLAGAYPDPALGGTVVYQVRAVPAGLGISFLAGIASGLLGIGGGVFKVPALNLFCGIPIKAAAATSNFMIGVTAAASSFLYFGRGEVRPAITAAIVLGILCGSMIGSYVNRFLGGLMVKRLFAIILVAAAAQMLVRSWL